LASATACSTIFVVVGFDDHIRHRSRHRRKSREQAVQITLAHRDSASARTTLVSGTSLKD
jgi:hypothetical protein